MIALIAIATVLCLLYVWAIASCPPGDAIDIASPHDPRKGAPRG